MLITPKAVGFFNNNTGTIIHVQLVMAVVLFIVEITQVNKLIIINYNNHELS